MSSSDTNTQLQQIQKLIAQKDYEEARKLLGAFLKTYPHTADGYVLAAFLNNDPARKIQVIQRALQLDPNHKNARKIMDSLQGGQSATSAAPSAVVAAPIPLQPESSQPPAAPSSGGGISGLPISQSHLVMILGAALGLALIAVVALAVSRLTSPVQTVLVVT